MKKPKKTNKKRNPVAKASSKMHSKVKPSKKKYPPDSTDQPSTGNYNYNSSNIFGGE